MSTLGERIDEARKLRGLRKYQLEERAGFSKGYLSRLIAGERGGERPTRTMIAKLAGALGVNEAWLANDEGERDVGAPPAAGPAPAEQLAPFDEAARFAHANGAPEWAIERVRTRAARLVRDRTADDYWQMIKAAIAEGEDEASIADVGHAPAPGDIAAPRRGRK